MKRFQFSLEPLMSLRKAKLEERELELSYATSLYNSKQTLIQNNQKHQQDLWQTMHTAPEQRKTEYLYLMRLTQERQQVSADLEEYGLRLKEAQNAYQKAHQELKALEKLQEKQFRQYCKERRKEEDAVTEEAARNVFYLQNS